MNGKKQVQIDLKTRYMRSDQIRFREAEERFFFFLGCSIHLTLAHCRL